MWVMGWVSTTTLPSWEHGTEMGGYNNELYFLIVGDGKWKGELDIMVYSRCSNKECIGMFL